MYFIGNIENLSEQQVFFQGNHGKGLKPPMPVLLIQLALMVVSETVLLGRRAEPCQQPPNLFLLHSQEWPECNESIKAEFVQGCVLQ